MALRRTKLLSLTTAAVLAASLTACGASGDDAAAEGNDVFKIGITAPLPGTFSTLAPAADGVRAYMKALNESGDLGDLEVEVIVKDDGYDPSKTPAVVRQLVEDEGVDMMCGPIGTGTTATVVDYLTARKVPTLAMTGEPAFTESGTTVFEVASSYERMGAAAAELVHSEDPDRTIAIAYSADSLGEPFRDGALAYLESVGAKAEAVEFDAAVADLSAPAAKLKASGADAVLVNHTSAILAKLAKSAAQQGLEPEYVSTNAPLGLRLAELAGGTLDGMRMVTPYLLGTEDGLDYYRDAVEKHTDAAYDEPVLVNGWTAAEACGESLKAAVKAAGGKPDADQLLEAMRSLEIDTHFLPDFSWTADKQSGTENLHVITFDGEGFSETRGYQPAPTTD